MNQLKCKICKVKRELTEKEITKSNEIIAERNLKPDAIKDIWNLYDGETCPQGGYHRYEWDGDFFQKMLDDASKIKDNDTQVSRNYNENIEAENKIKELQEKIEKNKESNTALVTENDSIKDNILKTSGRDWMKWL